MQMLFLLTNFLKDGIDLPEGGLDPDRFGLFWLRL